MTIDKLTRLIKSMFLCLALGFAYVLMRSIGGPSNFSNPKNVFDDIAIGQTAARRFGSKRVWVTRLSMINITQAAELSPHVLDARAGCTLNSELCVLLAMTDRSGIDVTYTQAPPTQLSAKVPWFGGFVDPTTGEVFDRLGRVYSATAKERLELEQVIIQ